MRNIPLWSLHHDNRESSKVRAATVNPVDHLEDRLEQGSGKKWAREDLYSADVRERKVEIERETEGERQRERGSAQMKEVWGSDESLSSICHVLVMDQSLFVSIF